MALPVLAIAAALKVAGSLMNMNAAAKQRRYVNRELAGFANTMREGFDYRYGQRNAGDATQRQIEREAYAADDSLQREGFSRLLGNQSQGFDEVLANARGGVASQEDLAGQLRTLLGNLSGSFGAEQDALGDSYGEGNLQRGRNLVATLRDVREGNMALSAAELDRQRNFQSLADGLAAAFTGSVGRPQFDTDRAGAEAARLATVNASVNQGPTDVPLTGSRDSTISSLFARHAAQGRQDAINETGAAEKLASYNDASRTSASRAARFGEDLNMLGMKAGVSASALPAELAVGATRAQNAVAENDVQSSIADMLFNARSRALGADYLSRGDAISQWGGSVGNARDAFTRGTNDYIQSFRDQYGSALEGLYDGRIASTDQAYTRRGAAEGAYTDSTIDASQSLENGLRDLMNQRIGSSSPSQAGSFVSALGDLAGSFSGGGKKGLTFKPRATGYSGFSFSRPSSLNTSSLTFKPRGG